MGNTTLSFIDAVDSAILIHESLELIEFMYDKTCVKCINLCIPHNDDANRDIISCEMKNTQEYIYEFLTSCTYQLHKDTIKELKKRTREKKYNATQSLYSVLEIK